MLCIMVIQFFASFGEGTKQIEMIVSLVQIATTFLSICSAKISLSYKQDVKGINFNAFCSKMMEREADAEINRLNALKEKQNPKKNKKKADVSKVEDMSSSETVESQQSNFQGFDNIIEELEMLYKDEDQQENKKAVTMDQDLKPIELEKIKIEDKKEAVTLDVAAIKRDVDMPTIELNIQENDQSILNDSNTNTFLNPGDKQDTLDIVKSLSQSVEERHSSPINRSPSPQ